MKYEQLPDQIKVGALVLRRSSALLHSDDRPPPTCVYYDSGNAPVHAHICYSSEGGDFCGHVTVPSQSGVVGTIFNSLGGHWDRYKQSRGPHCYATIEPLVAAMEKQIAATRDALCAATGRAKRRKR